MLPIAKSVYMGTPVLGFRSLLVMWVMVHGGIIPHIRVCEKK